MSTTNNNSADAKTPSSGEVYSYFAIPVESFQSIVEQQTVSDASAITQNLVIKTFTDGDVLSINDFTTTLEHNKQTNELVLQTELENKNTNSIFKCFVCKQTFERISKYRKHILIHRNAKRFKCEQCNASYNMEDNFKLHMAIHSKGPPCCPLCDRRFQRLASLKAHLIVHEVDETISCIKCFAEFEKLEDLDCHMEVHNKEESVDVNRTDLPLICSYCNYSFYDTKTYREHISYHVKLKRMIFNRRKKRINVNKEHPHKCSVCQKSFVKFSLLERHLRIHNGEKPYICFYCNKGFAQNGTLQIHLSRHKGLKPFSCILCPAKFNQKGNLRVHVQKTHLAPQTGEQVYKCTMCTCIFKRVASLNAHITRSHAQVSKESDDITNVMEQLNKLEQRTNVGNITNTDKVHYTETKTNNNTEIVPQERKCAKVIDDKNIVDIDKSKTSTSDCVYVRLADSSVDGVIRRYLVRQITVGDTRIYVCSYCEKQFKKPSDLIRHIRTHTREKPFKCKQCNQSFSLKSTLVSHFNTHLGRRDYKCVVCLKMFTSVRSLNTHIKKHNNRNPKQQQSQQQYKCTMCNKAFNSPVKMKAHLSTHYKIGKETQSKEEIIMQQPMLETANGLLSIAAPKSKFPTVELEEYRNRPFKCNICTAAFNKSVHLKRHLQRHTGDKRFKCDQCPKAFYNDYSLREHKKFHSGVKNYTCRLCNKKFITNVTLKRHYATHSSYRPYICPYCKRRFTTAILCRKHIKVHKKDVMKATGGVSEQISKSLSEVELQAVDFSKDFVTIPFNSHKTTESIVVSIEGDSAKKVMELPVENTELANSTHLLQDNVFNQQFYQLPLNIVQEFDVNEYNTESTTNNQVSLYINYDELQSLNTNLYGHLLSQTSNIKFQNDTVLLSEIPDTNTVFSLNNFTSETASFQENFNESVNLNILLNKQQGVELNTDVALSNTTYESANKNITEKKSVEKMTNLSTTDLNMQMHLTNVHSSTLPIFTSLDSNLCEDANTICIANGATATIKDLETHNCDGDKFSVINPKKKEKKQNNDSCVQTFPNKQSCIKHQIVHKNKKSTTPHPCQHCEKVFKKPSDLIRHLRTHTGEKPYNCAKCSKRFSLKSTLETHLKTHNPQGNKEFNCPVCNSCFSCKSSLKVHTALHTGTKSYTCNFCDAKFRTVGHKKSHEESHIKGTCRKNNTRAAKISNLLGPVVMDSTSLGDKVMSESVAATTTSTATTTITTSTDDIIFVQNPEQTDHIMNDQLNLLNQTIQIDNNLLQQLQNNGLLLQESLENDIILSTPLQLVSDGIKLSNVDEIDSSESGVKMKQYKCDICYKSYNTKAVLKKHKKIHGDGLEFRCNLCSKGFKNSAELEKHNKIHLGIRPHSCSFCDNTFSEERSLKTHMKRIHNVNNVTDILLNDYIEEDTDFIY